MTVTMKLGNLQHAIDAAAPLDEVHAAGLRALPAPEREVLAYALSLRSAAVRHVVGTLAVGKAMAEYPADVRTEVIGTLRSLDAADLSALKFLCALNK